MDEFDEDQGAHNFKELKCHILGLSDAKSWSAARLEWEFETSDRREGSSCPCGVKILERCHISNKKNGNETFVGNVCIKRFKPEIAKALDGLARVAKDPTKAPNDALVRLAYDKGLINDHAAAFLFSTARKRNLTGKQAAYRRNLNVRIVWRMNPDLRTFDLFRRAR